MVYATMAANCPNNSPAFQISDGSSIVPTNPDLWVYDTKELVSYIPQRRSGHYSFAVWAHFKIHTIYCSQDKQHAAYTNRAWCKYCCKPFVKMNTIWNASAKIRCTLIVISGREFGCSSQQIHKGQGQYFQQLLNY